MPPCIRVVAAMLEKDGCYLITQRRPGASLPLLWEFPGGRVENGESDAQALTREISEELGLEIEVGERAVQVHHVYSAYEIDFAVYRCTVKQGSVPHGRVDDHPWHRWVKPQDLDKYQFPPADEKTLAQLLDLIH
jgi:8-oxo-dGTP diphosphatase